jgi:hypothetical protein
MRTSTGLALVDGSNMVVIRRRHVTKEESFTVEHSDASGAVESNCSSVVVMPNLRRAEESTLCMLEVWTIQGS